MAHSVSASDPPCHAHTGGLPAYCSTSPFDRVIFPTLWGCPPAGLKAQTQKECDPWKTRVGVKSHLDIPGREVTPAHQYALAGTVSFPFFWLAGAGSAVFWVLGATLVVIGSHAAFHQVEAVDGEELQMEPV
ncbi:Prenylated Rab acceptor protein 1, partial [Eschrichtius robustus]|nr:Prenylated Rab acceptor protein 1 [Eschrichtius robustus]